MKHTLNTMLGLLLIAAFSFCSTPRGQMPSNSKSGQGIKREVIPVRVEAVSFQQELAGNWNMLSMRRQQKAELENLNGVRLIFDGSSNQFSGKAPCNNISGTIQLNGYSIRFQNIIATRMACDQLDQESAMLDLLQTRISAFTIDGNKLLLRDGSSNIVFECERAN